MKRIGFVIVAALAVSNNACTEESVTNVGTNEAAVSWDCGKSQDFQEMYYCMYGKDAKLPIDFTQAQVDEFNSLLQKNGGTLPVPEYAEYNGDGTVSRIKICFPTAPGAVTGEECLATGCKCWMCDVYNCYTIKYGTAVQSVEVGNNCLQGKYVQTGSNTFVCDTGGGLPNS